MRRRSGQQGGFAMLLVFVMAATVAIMLYRELPRIAFEAQRNKEQLLIERGEQYSRAIQLYVRKWKKYPATIDDLESTNQVRFLRKRYIDPMSGKSEWRLIKVGPGGVFLDSLVHKPPSLQKEEAKAVNTFTYEAPTTGSMVIPGQTTPGFQQTRPSERVGRGIPGMPQPGQPVDPSNPQAQPQPGVYAPNQPGLYNPNQAGQFNPNQPGQFNPNQPGQYNPNQPGQYNPNQAGQFNPNQPGQFNPNQPGQFNPNQPGQYNPNQPGQFNPNQPGQFNPNQPGQFNPNQPGQFNPNQLPPGIPGTPAGVNPQGYPTQTGVNPLQPFPQQPVYPGQPVNSQTGGMSPYPYSTQPGAQGAPPPFGQPGTTPLPGGPPGQNQALTLINQILTTPRSGGVAPGAQPMGGLQIGGGIAGVASTVERTGIKIYNEKEKYNEWEFLYDLTKDKTGMGAAMGPGIQQQQQQQGQQQGQQAQPGPIQSPFGQPALGGQPGANNPILGPQQQPPRPR